jgi:hypothetical protein
MSLVPAVTELMMAELLYLEYDSATKPINIYINSTGVTVRPPTVLVCSCMLICCLYLDFETQYATNTAMR